MEASVENTSTLGRRLKVSVPHTTVETQVNTRIAKFAREAQIKGFRPGKVPLTVVQKKYGPSLRQEVIGDIIREALSKTMEDPALKIAGYPKVDELKDKLGENLEFVASFEVYPEVTLSDFSQVEIEKRIVTLTDEDVQRMIARLQDQLGEWQAVDRAVKSGDKLKVDFARTLKVDDATREEQKNVFMVVGDKGVLPGLSEALVGKKINETANLDTEYTADWADKKVAGKGVALNVTILEITEKHPLSLAALNERLSVGSSPEQTLTLEEIVRTRMEEELEQTLRDEVKEHVLEKLLEKNPLELPQALIEQEKEAIAREVSQQRRVNIPKEALDQAVLAEQAKHRVELGLLLNEVISSKNLTADPKRVREQIEKMAHSFGARAQEIRDAYYTNKDLLTHIERSVLLEQAVDVLLEDVKVNEVQASYDDIMSPASS